MRIRVASLLILESQKRRPDLGAAFLGKRVNPSKAYDPDAPEFKPE